MIAIGVDENGLGPILGPLVVTGVAFEAPVYDPDVFWSLAGPDLVAGDSKVVFASGRRKRAERAVLSWLELFGVDISTHRSVEEGLSRPLPFPLPCDEMPFPCRAETTSLPAWSRGPHASISPEVRRRFGDARIEPREAACMIACAGALNRALSPSGANKLRLDFELMMGVVAALAKDAGKEVSALCGKVGSTRRYGPWLDGLRLRYRIETETAEASTYAIEGIGRVSFIRDADSKHLPVAVASMIGKYSRELAIDRLNAAFAMAGARRASGYRDPVTSRFIDETASARNSAGLPESCFVRFN